MQAHPALAQRGEWKREIHQEPMAGNSQMTPGGRNQEDQGFQEPDCILVLLLLLPKYLKYLIGVCLLKTQYLEDRAMEALHFGWGGGVEREKEREAIPFCVCKCIYLNILAVATLCMNIKA